MSCRYAKICELVIRDINIVNLREAVTEADIEIKKKTWWFCIMYGLIISK